MEKDFVPFVESLDLKELGFNELCFTGFYMEDSIYTTPGKMEDFNKRGENFTSRPLYQQAFRWFREKYDLHSSIESYNQDEKGNNIEYNYSYRIVTNGNFNTEMNKFYNFYEKAELACLRKLIEIVK